MRRRPTAPNSKTRKQQESLTHAMTDTDAITMPQQQPARGRASMQDAQADAEADHTIQEIYDRHTDDVHKLAPFCRHIPHPAQRRVRVALGGPAP